MWHKIGLDLNGKLKQNPIIDFSFEVGKLLATFICQNFETIFIPHKIQRNMDVPIFKWEVLLLLWCYLGDTPCIVLVIGSSTICSQVEVLQKMFQARLQKLTYCFFRNYLFIMCVVRLVVPRTHIADFLPPSIGGGGQIYRIIVPYTPPGVKGRKIV